MRIYKRLYCTCPDLFHVLLQFLLPILSNHGMFGILSDILLRPLDDPIDNSVLVIPIIFYIMLYMEKNKSTYGIHRIVLLCNQWIHI